jgi:hypothetical protein
MRITLWTSATTVYMGLVLWEVRGNVLSSGTLFDVVTKRKLYRCLIFSSYHVPLIVTFLCTTPQTLKEDAFLALSTHGLQLLYITFGLFGTFTSTLAITAA